MYSYSILMVDQNDFKYRRDHVFQNPSFCNILLA